MSGSMHRPDDEAVSAVSSLNVEVDITSSDSEEWERLQQLFYLMEQTAEADRSRVLEEHCLDSHLQHRVLAIFYGANLSQEELPADVLPFSGKIGPYSLLRLLGSGGIGSVYLAERMRGGIPVREALKVIAPHAAGPAFLERFHREQHILGSLDHPHITRMLDAGIGAGGQPYLVMEYVQGAHLDAYCDARKLGIPERIELFLQVCDAVMYAHRNLIVHLDLKPSNILVNDEGSVKLLDFGTSKLIQADSFLTTTVLATPAFASPEQLRNEPVTTACDIFSLGAILSILLVGERKATRSSASTIFERAMRESEPEPLSDSLTAEAAAERNLSETRLKQLVKGDLTTIVAKCLRPRPQDRYGSVDALAQDLGLYRQGRAVLARPQTVYYRVSKFVRRHRGGVAATIAVVLVIGATLSYAAWRQHQAVEEGRRAEKIQTFMHQLFRIANSNFTGKPAVTVPEFLRLGVKTLPDYIRNPADLLQAKIGLAESMFDDGDLDDAREIFQQTAAAAKSLKNIDAEAESEAFAGQIAFSQGHMSEGKQLTAGALRLSQRPGVSPMVRVKAADYYAWNRENLGFISDEDLNLLRYAANEARQNNLPMHEKAEAIHELANILEFRGQIDEAQGLYAETTALLKQDPASVCDQAEVSGEVADLKQLRLDFQGALPLWQQAYKGYTACSGADGREALSMLSYEALDLTRLGRGQEAVHLLEPSKAYWEKLPDPYGRWSAFATSLAFAYVAVGRYQEAEALESSVMKELGPITSVWHQGFWEFIWASSLAGQGRYAEALSHAEKASQDWKNIPASITINPEGKKNISDLNRLIADVRTHLSSNHDHRTIPVAGAK